MSAKEKQTTGALQYRETAEALQLPTGPLLEWSGNDLVSLEEIRHIMRHTLRAFQWWRVLKFYFPLAPTNSADRRFREWWGELTSMLDTGGFWAAVLERAESDLIARVFLESPHSQDDRHFYRRLIATRLVAPLPGIRFSSAEYNPERGLGPHLKTIYGPTAFIVRMPRHPAGTSNPQGDR